jgi:protein-S-isoprenylcysteine O-methyltransferase Ste14
MAGYALALFVLFFALAIGGRTALQLRWTGSSGHQHRWPSRPVEWTGNALSVAALGLFLAAPGLELAEVLGPIAVLDGSFGHAVGFVLYFLGLVGTLVAQIAMGRSWRIGVDESERTDLVTTGPFAFVRNPIFSAMFLAFLGLVLLAPNAVALVGFVALVVAVELQVRFVEEPYLLRTHGGRYTGYASRVGRFVPGAGKLKARSEPSWPS